MLVFWKHGYEATSIRQLEEATGLHAPSIYAAFGDKEGLFAAALQRYLDTVIGPGIEMTTGHGLAGVRAMFTSIQDKEPELPLGCLLAITSSEAGALGEAPKQLLTVGLSSIRRALRDHLSQAIEGGLLDPTVDVAATSDALVALYEGIQVLVRSSEQHVSIDAIAGPVLDRLLPTP